MEDCFSPDGGRVGGLGVIQAHYIVHLVSVIVVSAPPRIIRHQIPEVGDL